MKDENIRKEWEEFKNEYNTYFTKSSSQIHPYLLS